LLSKLQGLHNCIGYDALQVMSSVLYYAHDNHKLAMLSVLLANLEKWTEG